MCASESFPGKPHILPLKSALSVGRPSVYRSSQPIGQHSVVCRASSSQNNNLGGNSENENDAPGENPNMQPEMQPEATQQKPSRPPAVAEPESADTGAAAPPPVCDAAVLIEVDSCLFDLHRDGHRVAFIEALKKHKVPHSALNAQLYSDLMHRGGGTGEGLLSVYFKVIGWGNADDAERHELVHAIHETKIDVFSNMVLKRRIPLRVGAGDFLKELVADNVKFALVPATASHPREGVALAALDAIAEECGLDVANATAVVGGFPTNDGGDDEYGFLDDDEEVDNAGIPLDFEKALEREAAKRRSSKAYEMLNAVSQLQGVGADASLLANLSGGSAASIAVDEKVLGMTANLILGVGCARSAYVGAAQGSASKARSAGIMPVILRTSASMQAQFSRKAAYAVYDSYGAGGGLTWRRLKGLLDKHGGKLDEQQ
ncbi:hypothetical protein RI054_37g140130 [Pseudoscourfieldia marina]